MLTHYILSITSSVLRKQNLVSATETEWPAKPKIFPTWLFTEVCQPLVKNTGSRAAAQVQIVALPLHVCPSISIQRK